LIDYAEFERGQQPGVIENEEKPFVGGAAYLDFFQGCRFPKRKGEAYCRGAWEGARSLYESSWMRSHSRAHHQRRQILPVEVYGDGRLRPILEKVPGKPETRTVG
jgi:hypothetical protein